jgi:hypothetical protein
MRRMSAKRASQNRRYLMLRAEWLENRPACEFPGGCIERATTIQHLRGRRGERLTDTTYWASSCWWHNVVWAEDNPTLAYASGWKVRVEGAEDGAA